MQQAQQEVTEIDVEEQKSIDEDRLQKLEAKLLQLQEDLDTTKNKLHNQENKKLPTCPICQSAILDSEEYLVHKVKSCLDVFHAECLREYVLA